VARVDDAFVRREEAMQAGHSALQKGDGRKEEKQELLLEVEATSGSAKIVILFLLASVALVTFCAGAIYLVWSPLAAMFEERAFEQAASKAFLTAAPLPPAAPVAQGEATQDDSVSARASAPLLTDEAGMERKVEKLSAAWSAFLTDSVLQIQSSNVLYVAMQEMWEKTQSKQFDDLFDEAHAVNPEGAPLTGIDHLTRQDMERILDGIDGSVSGMAVMGGRINTIRPQASASCGFAVANVEDYGWLFDPWDTVFTEQEPLTKECFPGVMKLVLAWNFVRTLHTARHMRAEERGPSNESVKPTMQFTINLRSGKPLEVRTEVEYSSPPDFQGDSAPQESLAAEGASETMADKLARKSKTVEEVTMEDDKGEEEVAP
jgi:hypothetical protein